MSLKCNKWQYPQIYQSWNLSLWSLCTYAWIFLRKKTTDSVRKIAYHTSSMLSQKWVTITSLHTSFITLHSCRWRNKTTVVTCLRRTRYTHISWWVNQKIERSSKWYHKNRITIKNHTTISCIRVQGFYIQETMYFFSYQYIHDSYTHKKHTISTPSRTWISSSSNWSSRIAR